MTTKKYKILLLDADGTLFDFKRSEREALSEALTQCGITPEDRLIDLYSRINDGLWKEFERGEVQKSDIRTLRFTRLAEQTGLRFDVNKISADYVERLATKRYLIDGALEACERLHRDAALYIVTNGIYAVQQSRITESPVYRCISDIFVSEKIGCAKPHPAYFDYVFAHIRGAKREEALVVGDSLSSDIAGGIAAGVDVCWINPDGEKAPHGMKIDYTIARVSELPDLIFG